eukprot:GHVR01001498.1.p1 GENE.GHVR01001498.1~~GHVR01001498.1.p1  ORF type:complete len:189 (+),score=16.30 GHVR01001498.1:166-732(+)
MSKRKHCGDGNKMNSAYEETQVKVVKLLIDEGAHLNARDRDGTTALIAASDGQRNLLNLFNRNLNYEGPRAQMVIGFPLMIDDEEYVQPLYSEASKNGQLDMVRYLIESGVDVNARQNDGSTALSEASKNGLLDVVRILVDKGADVNATQNNGLIDASRKGYWDVVKFLIESGEDVDAIDTLYVCFIN